MSPRPHSLPVIAALVLLGFLLLSAASRAQSNQPVPDVRLRFLFLDESEGSYSLKSSQTSYIQLSTTPYVISRSVTVKADARVEIYKVFPAPAPADGRTVRIKIATLTPPAGSVESFVVITPRPTTPDATTPVYDVSFFESNPESIPTRSIRIINLGHASMAAMFGEGQTVVAPGSSQVIQPATDRRNRVFGKIAVQTAAGWKLLFDNITVVRPDERVTGVLVYSPSGLRHTYTAAEIAENGPPPPGHFWLTYAARN